MFAEAKYRPSYSGKSRSKKGFFFSPAFIQPKLTVNRPDDRYEREADAVADKVMRMPTVEPHASTREMPITSIQRKCAACEKEEKLQREEEKGSEPQPEVPSIVQDVIDNSSGKRIGEGTRTFMEGRLGYDFSDVKIHTSPLAAKSAQSINALAYTSGNNIVFNEGQYAPGTESGKRLLAHELTHTIQQRSVIQRDEGDQDEETRQRTCIREAIRRDGREPTEEDIDRQLEANRESERIFGRRIDVCSALESAEAEAALVPDIGANEVFPFQAGATVRLNELLTSHFSRADLESLLSFAGEYAAMGRRIIETLFNPDTPGSMVITVTESTPRRFEASGRTPTIPATGEAPEISPADVSFSFEWNSSENNFDARIRMGSNSFSADDITVTRDRGIINISVPDPGIQFSITQGQGDSTEVSLAGVPGAGGLSGILSRILRLPAQLIGMQQISESQTEEAVSRPESVTNPATDIGELRVRTGLGFGPDPFAVFGASWIYTFRPLGPVAEFPFTFDIMYLGPGGVLGDISAGFQTRILTPVHIRINAGLAGGGLMYDQPAGPREFVPFFGPTAGGGLGFQLGQHVEARLDYTGMLNVLEGGPGSIHTVTLGSLISF